MHGQMNVIWKGRAREETKKKRIQPTPISKTKRKGPQEWSSLGDGALCIIFNCRSLSLARRPLHLAGATQYTMSSKWYIKQIFRQHKCAIVVHLATGCRFTICLNRIAVSHTTNVNEKKEVWLSSLNFFSVGSHCWCTQYYTHCAHCRERE